jgi:nitrite reductase/ring-hydroxylating ferredoxin subunit
MQRRDFIKTTCLGCAGILGGSALLSMLNSCSPLPVLKTSSKDNVLSVPESSFVENQNVLIIKNTNFEFDILLVKKKDNTYNALYMQCTHENQPLSATKSGLFCSSHGSAFNLEGEVTVQPATKALKKFRTQTENNNVIIYLTT